MLKTPPRTILVLIWPDMAEIARCRMREARKQLNSATYVDVDNARQRVLGVGATLDGDPENGLGLLDGNSEVPLLIGHDKCTLHSNNP
jgi:hypothetical protein